MEKYITWYFILLKTWICKKSHLLQLVGMVLVILLIAGIHLPDSENVKVGLYNEDGEFAENIIQKLMESESVFVFETYESEENLKNAVINGGIECGFVFREGMEEKLERSSGKKKNLITYLATPLTTKGSVAKETVYAAFLETYSDILLTKEKEQVFGPDQTEVSQTLREKNQYFLEGDQIFQIHFTYIENYDNAQNEKKTSTTYPIQGMAAVIIFLILFLEHGKKFSPQSVAFERALNGWEAAIFRLLRYLSAVTFPAMTAVLCICVCCGGKLLQTVGSMLVFVLISVIWMSLAGRLFHQSVSYAAWTMTFVAVQLIICPVCVDLSQWVPAISWIRCLFPSGIYLQFLLV